MSIAIRFAAVTALTLSCTSPIWAQATDAGAARLKSALQTALGSAEDAISVTTAGQDYALTLDLARLVARDGGPISMTASPIEARLTDNGDGTWSFSVDQPFSMNSAAEGAMQASTSLDSLTASGVFDETLGDMSRYSVQIAGLTNLSTRIDPAIGEVVTQSTVESIALEGGARAGTTGVDGAVTVTASGIAFDAGFPTAEGAGQMQISGGIAAFASSVALTGYQPSALYPLLGWLLAHPGGTLSGADKVELKARLEAALPIFAALSTQDSYSAISVVSPMGAFGLDGVDTVLEVTGAVPDGRLREALTFRGLTLPEGALPPYAAALIPEELSLDVTLSNFDLAAATRLALGLMDQPEAPPAMEIFGMQLLMALMPQGAVDITLAPGGARNATYDLTYEGAMRVGMGGMPSGTARIGLTGVDAIMAALFEAPPDVAGQILPLLGMAQAIGQTGPDGELIWDIDATTPGSLRINGMEMMGMQ